MNKPYLTSTPFGHLNLHESLQESLADAGFTHCTAIQAEALPLLLQGKDLTGQAQTGTGKSAAFLLAIMHHLMTTPVENNKSGPFAIILAPTRELALQIHKDASLLGRYTGLKYAAIYGGTGYDTQRRQLEEGIDILIGTPGRVIDFYKQNVFTLRNIEVVTLDEADRMFDLGFITDLRYLLRQMPPAGQRLNMLFSATFSQRVLELAYEHMNDPQMVKIDSDSVVNQQISEHLYHTVSGDKPRLLCGLLRKISPSLTMVFVNTKRAAEEITHILNQNNFSSAVISGDIPQKKRESLLAQFTNGEFPILVATDVAARGLHIPNVTLVVNYDLPQDVEDYVHRIGRTGRAGTTGIAISLVCEEYVYSLPDIEAYIGRSIPAEMITDDLLIDTDVTPPAIQHRPMRRGHPAKRYPRRNNPNHQTPTTN